MEVYTEWLMLEINLPTTDFGQEVTWKICVFHEKEVFDIRRQKYNS